jgi:hypothetical protein
MLQANQANRWKLIEGTPEEPWIGALQDCQGQNQEVSKRLLVRLVREGYVRRRKVDLWRIILAASPEWPRTC